MKNLDLNEMQNISGGTSWLGAFLAGGTCAGAIIVSSGVTIATGGIAIPAMYFAVFECAAALTLLE